MWKKILPMGLVLVVVFSFAACAEETEEEVELPSAQEIVDGVIESLDEIRTYQFDMDVTYNMTNVGEDEWSEVTFALGYSGTVDVENRQMRMEYTNEETENGQREMQAEMEMYFIDGILYMMEKVPGEETTWKKEAPEEWWEGSQQIGWGESQIEILEAAQVEVIGSERVDGIDCYVPEVKPFRHSIYLQRSIGSGCGAENCFHNCTCLLQPGAITISYSIY